MILEMVGHRDPNLVPVAAFYGDPDLKVNFCGKLAADANTQVSRGSHAPMGRLASALGHNCKAACNGRRCTHHHWFHPRILLEPWILIGPFNDFASSILVVLFCEQARGYRNAIRGCTFVSFPQLSHMHALQVRLEFLRVVGDWMLRLRERSDHEGRLLPYILAGLVDEAPQVSESPECVPD